MPVLEACPLQQFAKTLDVAELNSRINQIISFISVTNQCFGYISYNYVNYLEQRDGLFFILRSGGTSYA